MELLSPGVRVPVVRSVLQSQHRLSCLTFSYRILCRIPKLRRIQSSMPVFCDKYYVILTPVGRMGTNPDFHFPKYTASRLGIHARPFAPAQWRESLLTIKHDFII